MSIGVGIAALSLGIWIYLILGRGFFWRARTWEADDPAPEPTTWPSVVAVIPARNEADIIPDTLASVLRQDYPGPFAVVLADDHSDDGTADTARAVAALSQSKHQLTIIAAAALPLGWTGKLWAVREGVARACVATEPPDYLLLTDADIAYRPDAVRRLVASAQAQGLALASLMVELHCESPAEKALVPAFVFFFQMLYPFAWVNDPRRGTAAAAGGCMLVRRDALARAGGIEAIRSALIDDCALARAVKPVGRISLGLTRLARSRRRYPALTDIRRMVSRSAYDQLGCSPLLLAGTVAGMALVYLAPPLFALLGSGPTRVLGIAVWVLMAAALQPMLRFYRRSPLWGLALPAIAATYVAFTLDSAYQHARGRGGLWKGRAQAGVSETR
ncbi:MAG: glycosyltransferase [Hyphomicrobiales bacterium]|nr:glycosyltransferase [Hyphomicrobiales bacterium]MBV8825792.1 glycosyltransferase [Hyphomicrobiales bacterium]MBV9426586.1 glycosyltransferase [Bradyrhizobiaceae bacterium]